MTSCDYLGFDDYFAEETGKYLASYLVFAQERTSPTLFAYRLLYCVVGENVEGSRALLSGSVNFARMVSTELNSPGSVCWSDGYRYVLDPATGMWNYEPWVFSEPVVIAAEWRDPEFIDRSQSHVATQQAGINGTTHRNCQSDVGNVGTGGMWVDGVYQPFVSDDPGWAPMVWMESCTTVGSPTADR